MSEDSETTGETPKKKSKLPLIVGLVLAITGAGGGFFLGSSGILTGAKEEAHANTEESSANTDEQATALEAVAFVEIPPVLISLQPGAQARTLRFRGSLEVPSEHESAVTNVLPRISDMLNSYLRALDAEDIEARGSLLKLRSQMMHRVDLIVGEGIVNDLLVMEFILN